MALVMKVDSSFVRVEALWCVCMCKCVLKSAKSSIKLKSRWPSEEVKSHGQMDAFQITHEALRAPWRHTFTESLASSSFKLEAGVIFTAMYPVAGLTEVDHMHRITGKLLGFFRY